MKAKLGSLICSHILFLHAMLGCDTTSRLYYIGKSTILKKFKAKTILHHSAQIFNNPNSTAKEIKFAGEKALVNIYNGKSNESLNTLHYRQYCEKLATNTTQVEPRTLPPTSAAAKFHNYRVFLQTCQWKSLDCDLSPDLWGWTKDDAVLSPTMTDLPPAPEDLLKIILCNCLTNCQNARCSCIKHGIKCSVACGHCHGSACSNAVSFIVDEDEDEDGQ